MLFYSMSISQLFLLVCETEAWESPCFGWGVGRKCLTAQMMKDSS